MTNAERIRNMSEEELAMFITACKCTEVKSEYNYDDPACRAICNSMRGSLCYGLRECTPSYLVEWLQEESK